MPACFLFFYDDRNILGSLHKKNDSISVDFPYRMSQAEMAKLLKCS